MTNTAAPRAGLFIYAKDMPRLADFYAAVLGLQLRHQTAEMRVLHGPDLQLVVQAMPTAVAAQLSISVPPQLRDQAAIKFFCSVTDLTEAQTAARSLGGDLLPEQWAGPGFVVRNAFDPEGNLFQLRQPLP